MEMMRQHPDDRLTRQGLLMKAGLIDYLIGRNRRVRKKAGRRLEADARAKAKHQKNTIVESIMAAHLCVSGV